MRSLLKQAKTKPRRRECVCERERATYLVMVTGNLPAATSTSGNKCKCKYKYVYSKFYIALSLYIHAQCCVLHLATLFFTLGITCVFNAFSRLFLYIVLYITNARKINEN